MKPSVRASSVEGLRRELKDLRRSVMDLHRMGGGSGASEPPGGSESAAAAGTALPAFFVAASNASDESKAAAHFVCDGIDDQWTIEEASIAFGGTPTGLGAIQLSEGEFDITANVDMAWASTLAGMGPGATILNVSGAVTAVSTDESSTLRDLSIVGNNTAGSQGIDLTSDNATASNVWVSGMQVAVRIPSGPTSYRRLLDCRLGAYSGSGTPYSLTMDGSPYFSLVRGCVMAHSVTMLAMKAMFLDNRLASGTTLTVESTSEDIALSGNFLPGGVGSFTDAGTRTQRGTNFSDAGTW